LIVGCTIDTHFSQRGRHGRLLAAVAHFPQDIGFGIDENTAMIVHKDHFEVIGEGAVTVIDGGAMSYTDVPYVKNGQSIALADVKIHVLPEGHKFDLKKREMIIPKQAPSKVKRAPLNENGKTKKK
jgi:cyanophycinase